MWELVSFNKRISKLFILNVKVWNYDALNKLFCLFFTMCFSPTSSQMKLAVFAHMLCGLLHHCNCFPHHWQRGNTCRIAEQVPDVFILTLIHCALHVLHLLLLQAVCYSTRESLSSSVSASLLLKPALTPTPICPTCLRLSFSQGLISEPRWKS